VQRARDALPSHAHELGEWDDLAHGGSAPYHASRRTGNVVASVDRLGVSAYRASPTTSQGPPLAAATQYDPRSVFLAPMKRQ
jgi:hypothetical protein